MATYTPNLNLGKPEATDAFRNFRQLFNDNMVKIDNAIGGGGGSGGHTIVNPSGTDMPAEGKLQFTGGVTVTDDSVNGKTVVDISGGGGNVYGAFIDTNRVIKSETIYSGSFSYNATEDCAVVVNFCGNSGASGWVMIDGIAVGRIYTTSGSGINGDLYYLKKGQTISASSQAISGVDLSYTAYGLTQGTSGIFTPIIYSDTERVVGVWRDNKPLYQRTFVFETPLAVSYSAFTDTTIDSTDIENIVDNHATHADGTNYGSLIADPTRQSHTKVGLQTNRNGNNANVKTLTIRYTKISDVAGSGNWNTDGVPTVHYSTSEQVIGTYFGKPLYQKSYSLTGGIAIGTYGHISMPSDSIIRRLEGYAYRSNHAVVDKFNGYIANGELFASIRNGDIEYWISNIFNPVEEIEFTVQYTKVTD